MHELNAAQQKHDQRRILDGQKAAHAKWSPKVRETQAKLDAFRAKAVKDVKSSAGAKTISPQTGFPKNKAVEGDKGGGRAPKRPEAFPQVGDAKTDGVRKGKGEIGSPTPTRTSPQVVVATGKVEGQNTAGIGFSPKKPEASPQIGFAKAKTEGEKIGGLGSPKKSEASPQIGFAKAKTEGEKIDGLGSPKQSATPSSSAFPKPKARRTARVESGHQSQRALHRLQKRAGSQPTILSEVNMQ